MYAYAAYVLYAKCTCFLLHNTPQVRLAQGGATSAPPASPRGQVIPEKARVSWWHLLGTQHIFELGTGRDNLKHEAMGEDQKTRFRNHVSEIVLTLSDSRFQRFPNTVIIAACLSRLIYNTYL